MAVVYLTITGVVRILYPISSGVWVQFVFDFVRWRYVHMDYYDISPNSISVYYFTYVYSQRRHILNVGFPLAEEQWTDLMTSQISMNRTRSNYVKSMKSRDKAHRYETG